MNDMVITALHMWDMAQSLATGAIFTAALVLAFSRTLRAEVIGALRDNALPLLATLVQTPPAQGGSHLGTPAGGYTFPTDRPCLWGSAIPDSHV